MSDLVAPYRSFWSTVLGVSEDELQLPGYVTSSSGRYVKAIGPGRVLVWTDFRTGKVALVAGSQTRETLPLEVRLGPGSNLGPILEGRGFVTEFDDWDYCLDLQGSGPPPVEPEPGLGRLVPLAPESTDSLVPFYARCTEDEVDTLDLDLDTDTAFGVVGPGGLVAVTRSSPISGSKLADVTVLVAPPHRGRGLGTWLVSRILASIEAEHRFPKYRVAADNAASQRVAMGLGLVKAFGVRVLVPRS